MKLNFNLRSKEASFEANVEKLVEKGITNHNIDWKEKFEVKHNAKKEMQDLKHLQKMELEYLKQNKKNWFEKRAEIKRQNAEQKNMEKRRKERQEQINFIIGISFLLFISVFYFIMAAIFGS